MHWDYFLITFNMLLNNQMHLQTNKFLSTMKIDLVCNYSVYIVIPIKLIVVIFCACICQLFVVLNKMNHGRITVFINVIYAYSKICFFSSGIIISLFGGSFSD